MGCGGSKGTEVVTFSRTTSARSKNDTSGVPEERRPPDPETTPDRLQPSDVRDSETDSGLPRDETQSEDVTDPESQPVVDEEAAFDVRLKAITKLEFIEHNEQNAKYGKYYDIWTRDSRRVYNGRALFQTLLPAIESAFEERDYLYFCGLGTLQMKHIIEENEMYNRTMYFLLRLGLPNEAMEGAKAASVVGELTGDEKTPEIDRKHLLDLASALEGDAVDVLMDLRRCAERNLARLEGHDTGREPSGGDPNDRLFTLPSGLAADDLRVWIDDWRPLDFSIPEDGWVWRPLSGQEDVRSDTQQTIERTHGDVISEERMADRREAIRVNLLRRHRHWSPDKMKPYLDWAESMKTSWARFQEVCATWQGVKMEADKQATSSIQDFNAEEFRSFEVNTSKIPANSVSSQRSEEHTSRSNSVQSQNEVKTTSRPNSVQSQNGTKITSRSNSVQSQNGAKTTSRPNSVQSQNEVKTTSRPNSAQSQNEVKITSRPNSIQSQNGAKTTSRPNSVLSQSGAKTTSRPNSAQSQNGAKTGSRSNSVQSHNEDKPILRPNSAQSQNGAKTILRPSSVQSQNEVKTTSRPNSAQSQNEVKTTSRPNSAQSQNGVKTTSRPNSAQSQNGVKSTSRPNSVQSQNGVKTTSRPNSAQSQNGVKSTSRPNSAQSQNGVKTTSRPNSTQSQNGAKTTSRPNSAQSQNEIKTASRPNSVQSHNGVKTTSRPNSVQSQNGAKTTSRPNSVQSQNGAKTTSRPNSVQSQNGAKTTSRPNSVQS